MTTQTADLRSTGKLAEDLQTHPAAILRAVETLGLRPSMRLNDLAYFDASAVKKIAEHLRRSHQPHAAVLREAGE